MNKTIHNVLTIQEAKTVRNSFSPYEKVIFITGVTGQDGSHMVDYLLANTNAIIFGGVRRLSVTNHKNVSHINNKRFFLVNFDLTDAHSIGSIVEKLKPDYFLNFAAQSFVASSWDFARQTWMTNCTAVLDILEAIRIYRPSCRFYNAGSSEEFGDVLYSPQDETHPLRPRSPYGASKAAARQLVKVYRESYNLFAIQGWLFNHEGTRRGEEFVTRKISKGVARIKKAIINQEPYEPIELGNIMAQRDWSDAEDFVRGVWAMLTNVTPKEYVLSSNETHTIAEFVNCAFDVAGIKGEWLGEGLDAKFVWQFGVLVTVNPKYYRPAEVELLLGDSSLARKELNWKPETSFTELVTKMVREDTM